MTTTPAPAVTRATTPAYSASLVLAAFMIPGLADADWEYDPVVRAGADFDDNGTLTARTDEVEDLSGFIGEASLGIAYLTQTGQFFIQPRLRTRSYQSEFDRDSDDQFLNLRLQHAGKTNVFSLRGSYASESVRTAELADADLDTDIDPDEIDDDDSGIVNIRQTRNKARLVPRWATTLSNTSKFVADVDLLSVEFDSEGAQQAIELRDYTDIRARLAYTRRFSARDTALLIGTVRQYETDFLDGDFTGYGLSAGFDRELTQTSKFRALIGVEQTEDVVDGDDPKLIADISLVRRQETTRLLAQYRRRVSPSGRGSLAERNEVNLRFSRELNEKFVAGLSARAYQSRRVGANDNETEYVQLHAQLLWRFTRAFSLQANYRHTVIDRSIVGESANANRFTLWLTYRPNSRSELRF